MSQLAADEKSNENRLQFIFNDLVIELQDRVEKYVGTDVLIRYNFQMGIHPKFNNTDKVKKLNEANFALQTIMEKAIENYRKLRVIRGDKPNAWEAEPQIDKPNTQSSGEGGPEVTMPKTSS